MASVFSAFLRRWFGLAMALLLGLAMPAGITAWLQGIAAVAR